jgi:hypothetical protein
MCVRVVGTVDSPATGGGSSGGVRVRRTEPMGASVPSQSSDATTPGVMTLSGDVYK